MVSSSSVHIADIDFKSFYRPAFRGSLEESRKFYDTVAQPGSDAKIVLHQAARMLWLADQIEGVAEGRPAFQVLFYLTAAELVAKIVAKYEGEGESKRHVQKFFAEMCASSARDRLARAFRTIDGTFLNLERAVNFLYAIRCDVVHRGRYYEFTLPRSSGSIPMLAGGDSSLISEITLPELRQIVLEGSVLAARQLAGVS